MRRRTVVKVLVTLAAVAAVWWVLADRPSPLSGASAPARALRQYIEAAQRKDCAAVVAALSTRSRELAELRAQGRSTLERMFCEYSPATANLPDFETDRIRSEETSERAAKVSASYTYDRFFGFFGRGRNRHTYSMVLEDGVWRVDLSESLDDESRPNQDRRAMFLVHQTYTAITDHRRSTSTLTADPATIRAELPGFTFPDLMAGVASGTSPIDTPFITLGPTVACVSLRSASGTLVMVKIPQTQTYATYQYGRVPSMCDGTPLSRPYYGTSSGIK